jgi:predicted transcriptional regulator
MSSNKDKIVNALQKAAKESEELADYVGEVVKAQNMTGVLVTTLLQVMIEKGMVTKEEVDRRFELNKSIALSDNGDCNMPLSKLLDSAERVK